MSHFSYAIRALTAGLLINLSQAPLAQSVPTDSSPISQDVIKQAAADYEALLAREDSFNDGPADTPLSQPSPSLENTEIINMEAFRALVIERAIANGAQSTFIVDPIDVSVFQTFHQGVDTDFHLTNVYQDYVDNPDVDLEIAVETITFLISSTESNRLQFSDESSDQPWLQDITPKSENETIVETRTVTPRPNPAPAPIDWDVDILPGFED